MAKALEVSFDQPLKTLNPEVTEGVELPAVSEGTEFPVTVDIPSKSTDDLVYHVRIDEDGFADCQCNGYKYRQRCSHTAAARKTVFGDNDTKGKVQEERRKKFEGFVTKLSCYKERSKEPGFERGSYIDGFLDAVQAVMESRQ